MSRLTAQLDGELVYLYRLTQGQYGDRIVHLYAHREKMTSSEIRARLAATAARVPEEMVDFDYGDGPPYPPDLFELAAQAAGFEAVDDEIEACLWMRDAYPPVTKRARLLRALEDTK